MLVTLERPRSLDSRAVSGMEVRPMFLEYYGLLEQPFSAACTSRRVYASHTHCEVLDSLRRSLLEDHATARTARTPEPIGPQHPLIPKTMHSLRHPAIPLR